MGCAGGFLAGMLGIGGGIIFIIVLNIYLHKFHIGDKEIVKYIIANSMLATVFAGISASVKQFMIKNFYLREIIVTAIPGIITGIAVTMSILNYNWYSKKEFSIFFLIILLVFAYKMIFVKKETPEQEGYRDHLEDWKYALTGALSGIISALTGLGGGILIIPFLHSFMKLRIHKATSISLGVIPLRAIAVSIYYALVSKGASLHMPMSTGYILPPLVLPLIVGVVIFAPIGVRAAQKLPQHKIRVAFGALILIVCLRMLYVNFF